MLLDIVRELWSRGVSSVYISAPARRGVRPFGSHHGSSRAVRPVITMDADKTDRATLIAHSW